MGFSLDGVVVIPLWCAPYVGLPYVQGGRSLKGVDCWGLVRLVLQDRAGLELPVHGATRFVERALARAMAGPDWSRVEQPRALDVVIMVTPVGDGLAAPLHVGVMVSATHLLHVDEDALSHCVALRDATVRPRLDGFWRHRELMDRQ